MIYFSPDLPGGIIYDPELCFSELYIDFVRCHPIPDSQFIIGSALD